MLSSVMALYEVQAGSRENIYSSLSLKVNHTAAMLVHVFSIGSYAKLTLATFLLNNVIKDSQ